MRKKISGIAVLLLFAQILAPQDKSKKAYELIYEDVQLLKKAVLAIGEKVTAATEEIRLLKDQMKDIQSQLKLFQADQANSRGELKSLPSQYQVLLEKIEFVNQQLTKIAEDLLVLRVAPPQATGQEQEKKETQPPSPQKKQPEQKKPEQKKEETTESKAQEMPRPTLSPQEVYNTAYSDYLKGNFDLAIDGFKIYREQFPDSPLVDNALYWIGECLFSQQKFNDAIDLFNDLILNYPQSDKIAATYLKKGLSFIELRKKEEALSVFKLLVSKFPFEEETKIAQQKIKDLTSK